MLDMETQEIINDFKTFQEKTGCHGEAAAIMLLVKQLKYMCRADGAVRLELQGHETLGHEICMGIQHGLDNTGGLDVTTHKGDIFDNT